MWYTRAAVGHNILGSVVLRVCEKGGVKGHFTKCCNATKSRRATDMQRTGHSSNTGVRSYKRIGERLLSVTSDVE